MSETAVRWGIIGAGIIAHKLADAVKQDPDSVLVSVASKTLSKAQAFANSHDIEADKTYLDLVLRKDIDVVYVATTHNFHYENAKLALENGKHVLVEKPFTVNAHQAANLIELAKAKNCFLMEAIWVRFLPSIMRIKSLLAQGTIGEIKLFDISFGNIAPDMYRPRLTNPSLTGGVTLDMGIYPITFVNYMLDDIPSEHKSMVHMSPTGVDEIASYQFRYTSGCMATINTSYNLKTRHSAMIYGSVGYIDFPNFQSGSIFTINLHNKMGEIESLETMTIRNDDNGFIYQVAEVVKQVRAGALESPVIPLEETLDTMKLMDEMRAEWGLKYPGE